MLHGYAYDARNRLERAWNEEGEEAAYLYNGMGQRVEKRSSTEPEEFKYRSDQVNYWGLKALCQTPDYLR